MSLSTAKAEFVSAAAGGVKTLEVKELMLETGMQVKTYVIRCIDNKASIQQINNEAASVNGKHAENKCNFSCDYAAKRKIKTEFADTKLMVADLQTKPLPAPRVQELCDAIGLVPNH